MKTYFLEEGKYFVLIVICWVVLLTMSSVICKYLAEMWKSCYMLPTLGEINIKNQTEVWDKHH